MSKDSSRERSRERTGSAGVVGVVGVDRATLTRDVLDALSGAGAALGALEFINRAGFTPAQLAAWHVVERNLCAACVALDALASGLGIQSKPDRQGASQTSQGGVYGE